jgi:uncharacterized protein
MKQITPRCALITGASQGLGRAFAEECAGRGMDLILAALPDTGLPETARILERAHGVRIACIETDLTTPEAPRMLADLADREGFDVDVLINNAGVGFPSRFEESSPWQNEASIQLNMATLVRLTQVMLPRLRQRPRGWILNVASLGAFFPMPSMPVYSSTKRFVYELTLLLHDELKGSTVSATVLVPNGIRTNRACRQLIERQGWAGRMTCQYPDEVARAGLAGLFRGKAVVVPGPVNRALKAASGMIPRDLYMRVISRRWGTEKKRVAGRPQEADA